MFPKPPRPEPPRRAIATIATQVVQQRQAQRAPDLLVVERRAPAGPPQPAVPPAEPGTP